MDTSNFKEVFESPKVKELTAQVADREAEIVKLRNALETFIAEHEECEDSDGWITEFAEALIAEIAKQNDPVAWWNGKETAFFEHETDGPVGEVKIPLYTFPLTAEQIANETAEACAKYVNRFLNGDGIQDEAWIRDIESGIRRGAWKEFKNV